MDVLGPPSKRKWCSSHSFPMMLELNCLLFVSLTTTSRMMWLIMAMQLYVNPSEFDHTRKLFSMLTHNLS